MRGDSLRDLYAKVLALCGLGLLAGAGALVDYWPVPEELPRVASGRPVPPPPVLLAAAPDVVPGGRAIAATVTPRPVRRAGMPPSAIPSPAPAVPIVVEMRIEPATVSAAGIAASAVLPEPTPSEPAPAPFVVASAEVPGLDLESAAFRPASVEVVPRGVNHGDSGSGFFTGAFKKTGAVASASIAKTGDAIAKGGAAAGGSIVDVLRGLAGAVKKVSPFVP